MVAPYELFRFLIEPIRVADNPRQFLLRYVQGMQATWDTTYDKIEDLPEITDWELTPDSAIRFLLWHVGVTSDLNYLVAGLSTDDLRRIASIIATFWKQKGTQPSLTDMLRFVLSKKQVEFYDYFYFRWLLEENYLDEQWDGLDAWVLNLESPDLDAFRSLIQIEDLKRDLNQSLTLNLLELARPSSERFEVQLLDLLEQFSDGDRWTKIAGAATPTVEDGFFKISTGAGQWVFDIAEGYGWAEYYGKFKFKFTGTQAAGEEIKLWWYSDDTLQNAYGVSIKDGVQQLIELTSGAESNLGSSADKSLDHDVWYTITVLIQLKNKGLGSESTRMIVYLDGAEIIDYDDASSLHAGGSVGFEKVTSSNDVWFDFVKVNPIPFRIINVIPQGA